MLYSHGIMRFYQSGYVSNNEDAQRPRPKKAKLISPYENVVITTID